MYVDVYRFLNNDELENVKQLKKIFFQISTESANS